MVKRMVSLLATLILAGVGLLGITASPAQANTLTCGSTNICFADSGTSADYSYPANYPRNTCIDVSTGPAINLYENNTQYIWFIFKTSACSGSHAEILGGWDGGILGTFGSDWDQGALHGVFRTSTVG